MSDEPKEKAKKLRLSRDVTRDTSDKELSSPPVDSNETTSPIRGDAQRADANLSPESAPEVSSRPEGRIEPQGTKGQQGPPEPTGGHSTSDGPKEPDVAPESAAKAKLKLNQQTDNPRNADAAVGSSQSVSKKPTADADGKNVEAVRGSNAPVVESQPHSILPSLLVVGLLFSLLGAAGFGLWKILVSPETSETSTESEQIALSEDPTIRDTAEARESKNPIERAKETIAKVSTVDLDQVTGETEPAVEAVQVVEAAPKVEAAQEIQATPQLENLKAENEKAATSDVNSIAEVASKPASSGVSMESTAAIDATKANVSQFLGSLHIGGIRQGDRPMILIDGQAHTTGDTVHPETGLKFDGFRNGKLAFVDQNSIVYLKSF